MVVLRDYQMRLFNETQEAFRQGFRRPLVVAPCGAGKTYLFIYMTEAVKHGEVLVLVHRQELKNQHIALFKALGIDMSSVRVEMVRTEYNRLGKHEKPALIILDEAHLSRSNTYVKIIEYYGSPCVGMTATPVRLDGKPLGDIYDIIIDEVDARYLIENNRLAPYEYYAPHTVDVSNLKKQCGEFKIKDTEDLVMNRQVYGDVIDSYRKIADGKKTIAYCVSVRHSQAVADAFNEAGIPAAHIDGNTPKLERETIMQRFRDGEIQVLSNCMLIIEGISIDDCECCLLLRPTESLALYIQSAMRCMRFQEGKTAIIIDMVGNYTRHGMPDEHREWSLDKPLKKREELTEHGTFVVRQCPKCFRCFRPADICPHCGAEYTVHPRELEAIKEIEIKRITEEQARQAELERIRRRQEVGRAKTWQQLCKIAYERGYTDGWIWHQCELKKISPWEFNRIWRPMTYEQRRDFIAKQNQIGTF